MRRIVVYHAVLFVVALLLRLALAQYAVGLAEPPKWEASPDQYYYEAYGYHLSIGRGYVLEPGRPSAVRVPVASWLIAAAYLPWGRSYAAVRVLWCVMSAACCPLVGWTTQRLLGPIAGLLAAAWLAFYPGHAYYAIHFLSETPTALLTAAAVALQLYGIRRPAGASDVAAGLSWGLAILCRPNQAVAGALGGLVVSAARELPCRRRMAKAALLLAATVAVTAPWLVRNHRVVGQAAFCIPTAGFTFWGAHNPLVAADPELAGYWIAPDLLFDLGYPLRGNEVEREAQCWAYARTYLAEHPEVLPRLKWHALLRTVGAYSETSNRTLDLAFRFAWLASLPLVLVGAVVLWRRDRLSAALLFAPLVGTIVTALMFYGCARFRDVASPQFAVLVAAGAVAIGSFVSRRRT